MEGLVVSKVKIEDSAVFDPPMLPSSAVI